MSAAEIAVILKGIADLLGAIAWPFVLLVVVLRFAEPLRRFLQSMSELSLKGAGIEATIRGRVDAAVAVGSAVATKSAASGTAPEAVAAQSQVAAHNVVDSVRPWMLQRLRPGSKLLWVDDRPDNNVYERQALEALGIRISEVTSTEDALEVLKRRPFEVVVSDMKRPPDDHAGFTLLDELQKRRHSVPVLFYVGHATDEFRREARQRGAFGLTDRPDELVQMVVDALVEVSRRS